MNVYCTNCGTSGHQYKHCRNPITSYGLIIYKKIQNNYNKVYCSNYYWRQNRKNFNKT